MELWISSENMKAKYTSRQDTSIEYTGNTNPKNNNASYVKSRVRVNNRPIYKYPEGNLKLNKPENPKKKSKVRVKDYPSYELPIGNLDGTVGDNKKQTVYDPNDFARTTRKEQLHHKNYTGQYNNSHNKHIVYDPNDLARTTAREQLHTMNYTGAYESQVSKQKVYDPNDLARTTIK